MIRRLTIVGVGLIGGSLALALKRAGYCQEIVGYGRNKARLQLAHDLGVIDRSETDMAAALRGSDMVVVATPVGRMSELFRTMAPHLEEATTITDVGSTKGSVVDAVAEGLGEIPATFVPGHPIAGTEKSGVEAAFAELFERRRVILTPLDNTSSGSLQQVEAMWQASGAIVEQMGVEHHDEVLAATSHLPHILAYALVDALAQLDEKAEVFRYAAGGFVDFTRIASSDPTMWTDITLANQQAIATALHHFGEALVGVSKAIEEGDRERLMNTFQRAKRARDGFCEAMNYAKE